MAGRHGTCRPCNSHATSTLPDSHRGTAMAATNRILVIVTNVGEYEKVGFRTGLWLGEMTHFWDVAEKARYRMDVASPSGGYVPVDPESLAAAVLKEGGTGKRYEDRAY